MNTLDAALPYLHQFSYLGVFILLVASSFFLPFSKTLVLVATGILVSQGVGSFHGYFFVTLVGILFADSIYFYLGYFNRRRILAGRYFSSEPRKKKLVEAENMIKEKGWIAVLVARFLPFIRGFIFLVAGLNRMQPVKVLLINAASTAIYIPVAILTGYLLAENRELLLGYVREGELLLGLIAIVVIVYLAVWLRKSLKKQSH